MPPFSIANELSRADTAERARCQRRLDDLRSEAANYGDVEIRDDSRMAWRWCCQGDEGGEGGEGGEEGKEDLTMHTVLSQMGTSQFIFSHTDYGDTCEEDYKRIANTVHEFAPDVQWSLVWKIVRKHAPTVLKLNALERAGYSEGVPEEQFQSEV